VTNTQGYVEAFNGAQWTTFIFTRPFNSGDNSDIAIVNGPMHLLYAVGQSGSVNYGANTFQQHSSKGDVVVNFFDLNGTVVVSRKLCGSDSHLLKHQLICLNNSTSSSKSCCCR
jgi:hypothetical protein